MTGKRESLLKRIVTSLCARFWKHQEYNEEGPESVLIESPVPLAEKEVKKEEFPRLKKTLRMFPGKKPSSAQNIVSSHGFLYGSPDN